MKLNRIVIYSKDVERITGKSDRYARKILKKIREAHQKQRHQVVSLEEFCDYIGLKPEEVSKYLE